MDVLLINQNATIERLVTLSSNKLGFALTKVTSVSDIENRDYGFIMIDCDLYQEDELHLLIDKYPQANIVMIISKTMDRPSGVDIFIEKPFLPTELVETLSNAKPKELSTKTAGDLLGEEEEYHFDDDISSMSVDDGGLDLNELMPNQDELLDSNKSLEDEFSFDTTANIEDGGLEDIKFDDELMDEMPPLDDGQEVKIDDLMDEESLSLDDDDSLGEFSFDEELKKSTPEAELSLDDEMSDELMLDEATSIDDIDSLDEELSSNLEDEFSDDELKLDEDAVDVEEVNEEEEEESSGLPSIFNDDEVSELKNLLDDDSMLEQSSDEIEPDSVKISNSEFGSLTQESLAEALGVSLPSPLSSSHSLDLEEEKPVKKEQISKPSTSINAIDNDGKILTLDLQSLRTLLEGMNITINITINKKD